MQKILPVSKVQPRLYALVKEVSEGGEPVIVTRRAGEAAVLLGREEYESLVATVEVMSSPGLLQSIRRSMDDIAAGRVMTLAQLKRRLKKKSIGPAVRATRH